MCYFNFWTPILENFNIFGVPPKKLQNLFNDAPADCQMGVFLGVAEFVLHVP